jgi:hypothetical protein
VFRDVTVTGEQYSSYSGLACSVIWAHVVPGAVTPNMVTSCSRARWPHTRQTAQGDVRARLLKRLPKLN